MKTIYLNKGRISQKNIGGILTPNYVDLTKSDNPCSIGIEYDQDGETYRAFYNMLRISPLSDELFVDITLEVQTKGGEWKNERNFTIAASKDKYIQGIIGATLGYTVTSDVIGAMNEVDFFIKYCGHGDAGLGGLAIPIYDHILNAIKRELGFLI